MIILYVDATLDYKSYYAPHIDKKLGGYGYSSEEVGYHWLQHDESREHSDTGIAFKKFQSDTFVDIALQRKDVPASERPPPDVAFTPHPLFVENGWEKVTILASKPTGRPGVAPLDAEFDYGKVTTDIEETLGELGPEFATRMLEWREWLSLRPRTQADAESCASLPGWGDWPHRRVDGPSAAGAGPADIARSRVLGSSVTIVAPRRITSSVGDGAEGIAASKANKADDQSCRKPEVRQRMNRVITSDRVASYIVTLRSQVLESNSWVFYRAKYDCCENDDCGGAHLPLLLAQLGGVDEIDTQDPDARLEIKCWTPAEACYNGDWVKWKEKGKHLVSTVSVAEVALSEVYFTTKNEKKGGKRMVALAIRTQLKGHSQSNYVKFGEKPASGAKVKGTKRRARESSSSEEESEEEEDEEEEEEEEEEEDEDEDDDCSAPGVAAPGSPQRRRR